MPLDSDTQAHSGREAAAKEIFENCGATRESIASGQWTLQKCVDVQWRGSKTAAILCCANILTDSSPVTYFAVLAFSWDHLPPLLRGFNASQSFDNSVAASASMTSQCLPMRSCSRVFRLASFEA